MMHDTLPIVRTAALAAEASRLAYSERAEYLRGYGLGSVRRVGSTEWQVWLAARGSDLPTASEAPRVNVLAVRGTTDLADWTTDAKALLVDATVAGQACRVHCGAERALYGRDGAAAAMAVDLAHAGPWILTGHSLGGLLARRLAASLPERDVYAVHLFGAPRGGDAAYCRAYPHLDATWEWQRPGDPVPSLPCARPWGYRHLPRLLSLPDDAPPVASPSYLRRTLSLRPGIRHAVTRHSISHYATRLAQLATTTGDPTP